MTDDCSDSAERVRQLNDAFRRSFVGGVVVVTAGVEALPRERRASLLAQVRAFDAFNEDNDPHGEHDFGAIELEGEKYFFKLDYYAIDNDCMGSEDPSDPVIGSGKLTQSATRI